MQAAVLRVLAHSVQLKSPPNTTVISLLRPTAPKIAKLLIIRHRRKCHVGFPSNSSQSRMNLLHHLCHFHRDGESSRPPHHTRPFDVSFALFLSNSSFTSAVLARGEISTLGHTQELRSRQKILIYVVSNQYGSMQTFPITHSHQPCLFTREQWQCRHRSVCNSVWFLIWCFPSLESCSEVSTLVSSKERPSNKTN